jgi:hypothetical protein
MVSCIKCCDEPIRCPTTFTPLVMGAAYFIVLEREIQGLDTMMDGKSLSRHIKVLDDAAHQLGVRPLSEFFSISPERATEFLDGEGVDSGGLTLPPLKQFSAQDGLDTVRALLSHTAVHVDRVVTDLHECERILDVAAQYGVRWHFEIDI